jgi:vacuolar protein sorting-associated protein 54
MRADGACSIYRCRIVLRWTSKMDSPSSRIEIPTSAASQRNRELPSLLPYSLLNISDLSASLARNLRAMSHGAFLSLARDTYLGLLGCIELVDLHAKVLLDLVADMRVEEDARRARRLPPPPSLTTPSSPSSLKVPTDTPPRPTRTSSLSTLDTSPSKDHQDLASDISDVIHATAELANLRFSKIISVRTDLHSTLSLAEFVEIFDASWDFVVQCEVICRKMIVGLRGIMVGQAKAFLQAYHQKRITESAKVVENEQWGAAEVPRKTQRVVELILQSAVSDPIEFLLGNRARGREKEEEVEEGEMRKQLDIEGREYFAVAAGLASVEVLADYLKVVVNCPILTTDVMSKVVEYMKVSSPPSCGGVRADELFLSRLIRGRVKSSLGQEPCALLVSRISLPSTSVCVILPSFVQSLTMRISALASQALSIMISLIPYIRETLRRHLNPKQAVMLIEFDKLKRDFQEHQNEIHSKLVAIMSDRLQIHCKTLEVSSFSRCSRYVADELP